MLPSSSSVYKHLAESKFEIDISLDSSVEDQIYNNVQTFFNQVNGFYSIKMDELAIKPRCRYYKQKNEVVGTCINHKSTLKSLKINEIIVLSIYDGLVAGDIHLAKECLVISIANVSNLSSSPKPVALFPICSHSNEVHSSSALFRFIW